MGACTISQTIGGKSSSPADYKVETAGVWLVLMSSASSESFSSVWTQIEYLAHE